MKKFIFPALLVVLYIGAFASNYECAVFGGAATVLKKAHITTEKRAKARFCFCPERVYLI